MITSSKPKTVRILMDWISTRAVVAIIAFHSQFSAAVTQFEQDVVLTTKNAPAALGPYSQAIRSGGTLYLSGQLPIDPATGNLPDEKSIESQTRRSLDNIKSILAADGLDMSDIVQATIYLTDLNDFEKMNEAYSSYFSAAYPARVTVEVRRLPKGASIEIASVAKRHD